LSGYNSTKVFLFYKNRGKIMIFGKKYAEEIEALNKELDIEKAEKESLIEKVNKLENKINSLEDEKSSLERRLHEKEENYSEAAAVEYSSVIFDLN
jgi:predicted  nucleic acid-binding Zn-ribbon protein